MGRLIALPGKKSERGNPNWGTPPRPLPALMPEFETQVERLGLTKAQYVTSTQLKHWCERNRNRYYFPEWLLAEWGMKADATFSGVA